MGYIVERMMIKGTKTTVFCKPFSKMKKRNIGHSIEPLNQNIHYSNQKQQTHPRAGTRFTQSQATHLDKSPKTQQHRETLPWDNSESSGGK